MNHLSPHSNDSLSATAENEEQLLLRPPAAEAIPTTRHCQRTHAQAHALFLNGHHRAAVELCNVGARLVEAGEYVSSIETLRDAAEFLSRPSVRIDKWNCYNDAAQFLDEYDRNNRATISRAHAKLPDALLLRCNNPKQEQENDVSDALLVYSKPMILLPPPCNDGSDSEELIIEEAAAAVLFNLALAHHLLATTTTMTSSCSSHAGSEPAMSLREQRNLLNKAFAFYQMSLSTLLNIEQRHNDEQQEECGVTPASVIECLGGPLHLACAVLNNAGQICLSQGGDHLRGRVYFNELESILPRGDDGGMDLNIFATNALMARSMNAAPSA